MHAYTLTYKNISIYTLIYIKYTVMKPLIIVNQDM